MKIYFSASSVEKEKKGPIYKRVVKILEDQGHEVFEKVLSDYIPQLDKASRHDVKDWHEELSAYLSDCDLVVIEGSYPSSIQVGFVLGLSLMKGKSTILLFEKGSNPVIVDEFFSSKLIKSEYTLENLEEVVKWCLKEAEFLSNRRFTFYISPEIDAFLEKISDKGDKSRSEYIRQLIEKEIKKTSS